MAAIALAALFRALPEQMEQDPSASEVGPNPPVDGLPMDVELTALRQLQGNLLRRPSFQKVLEDGSPLRFIEIGMSPGPGSAGPSLLAGAVYLIGPIVGLVPLQLAVEGGAVSTHDLGDFTER